MTATELKKDLMQIYGPFMNKSQLKHGLRIGTDTVNKLVRDLAVFPSGRSKRYYVGDIAGRYIELQGGGIQ